MSGVNSLLAQRLKSKEKSSKMAELSKQSATGNLTTFSGMFSVGELNDNEKGLLEAILLEYAAEQENLADDLTSLISITSEVKAINNQAAILHGERIKRAQQVLTRYKDGAFTAWLVAAYGNRQTPYNFLQYYEFYTAVPKTLRPQIEAMPRQAVYTLASREGSLAKKQKIVRDYQGETKAEVMSMIREHFPLAEEDKRKQNVGESLIQSLNKLCASVAKKSVVITKKQKKALLELAEHLQETIESCKTR